MKIARAAAVGWLACVAGGAFACGYCIEDRVAAVYDHAIVTRTIARGHEMAFLALEIPPAKAPPDAAAMRKTVEALPGVDRDSVRVDVSQGALSIAFDPRRVAPGKLVSEVERALGTPVTILRFGAPGAKGGGKPA
jgi:hypothetical protein